MSKYAPNVPSNPADTSRPLHGRNRAYAYDSIGNRTSSSTPIPNSSFPTPDSTHYTANGLNQYTSRTVPGTVPVTGDAPLDIDVYVNGAPADRQGPHWHAPVTAGNTQSAAYPEVETLGVFIPQDPDAPDEYAAATGRVFIAKTPEVFTYDPDGNLLSDGRFTYTWNGENRLILAETRADLPPGVPRHRVTYAYDHQGRMASKELFTLTTNHCSLITGINFLWDNWNIIAEQSVSPTPNSSFLITNCIHYAWGLDLSGSLQGAGGVGALLAAIRNDGTYAPTYDANGNVTEYVSLTTDHSPLITSPIAAHYEYDPFGNIVAQTGSMSDAFAFRFSTKYWEIETAILHYELRHYSPSLGRWLSSDPIGEEGGINLYLFLNNSCVNVSDFLGLMMHPPSRDPSECFSSIIPDLVKFMNKLNNAKPSWLFWGGARSKLQMELGVITDDIARLALGAFDHNAEMLGGMIGSLAINLPNTLKDAVGDTIFSGLTGHAAEEYSKKMINNWVRGGDCKRLVFDMMVNEEMSKEIKKINNEISEKFSNFEDNCPCSVSAYSKHMKSIRNRWANHQKTIDRAIEKTKKEYNKKCLKGKEGGL